MSCFPGTPTFRRLDPTGGWEEAAASGVAETSGGLKLLLRSSGPAIGVAEVDRLLLPSWLATDGNGAWYLVVDGVLRRMGPCDDSFACDALAQGVSAVAAHGALVAAVTGEGREIALLDDRGRRSVGMIAAGDRVTAAFLRDCELVVGVVGSASTEVVGFALSGQELWRVALGTTDAVVAVGVLAGTGGRAELVVATTPLGSEWFRLWRVDGHGDGEGCCGDQADGDIVCCPIAPSDVADLTSRVGGCVVIVRDPSGTWTHAGVGSEPNRTWFDSCGCPHAGEPPFSPAERWERSGRLETVALDGGHEAAEWSRVVVDADVPAGTSVSVSVASPGSEWETLSGLDALIQRLRPGPAIKLRIELAGDGFATPTVRSVRVDIDARSALHDLPALYSEDPKSAEFNKRFLSIFESGIAELDDAVTAASVLFDAGEVRDELLPLVASAIGFVLDPTWDGDQQRRFLQRAPALTPTRGTISALKAAVETVYGIEALVIEHGLERSWGVLRRRSHIGSFRVARRSSAAVRLDLSALGSAPIDGNSDPAHAAFQSGAYQVTVALPHRTDSTPSELGRRAGMERLVRDWLPAHLDAMVVFGSPSAILGPGLRLGIDTALRQLPGAVLRGQGERACRLGRSSVLVPSGRFVGRPIQLGVRSNVGVNTTVG